MHRLLGCWQVRAKPVTLISAACITRLFKINLRKMFIWFHLTHAKRFYTLFSSFTPFWNSSFSMIWTKDWNTSGDIHFLLLFGLISSSTFVEHKLHVQNLPMTDKHTDPKLVWKRHRFNWFFLFLQFSYFMHKTVIKVFA